MSTADGDCDAQSNRGAVGDQEKFYLEFTDELEEGVPSEGITYMMIKSWKLGCYMTVDGGNKVKFNKETTTPEPSAKFYGWNTQNLEA